MLKFSNLKTEDIDEIIMGQVLTGGSGQNPARQAAMKSGIPKEKPAYIVNQVCGSGIRSVASAFQSIKTGESKIDIAGGQERYEAIEEALADQAAYVDSHILARFWNFIKNFMKDVFGLDFQDDMTSGVEENVQSARSNTQHRAPGSHNIFREK